MPCDDYDDMLDDYIVKINLHRTVDRQRDWLFAELDLAQLPAIQYCKLRCSSFCGKLVSSSLRQLHLHLDGQQDFSKLIMNGSQHLLSLKLEFSQKLTAQVRYWNIASVSGRKINNKDLVLLQGFSSASSTGILSEFETKQGLLLSVPPLNSNIEV